MLPKNDKPMMRVLLRASMIGIQLVVATFIGLAIGVFLDSMLGTKPWFTFIFLGLGLFTGFRDMYRMAKDAVSDSKNDIFQGDKKDKDEDSS